MAATILIADDDAVQRRLVENMVQKCGYEPLVVDSGDAAVALLTAPDAPAIDAVVLDLVMPGLDGLGVLAKMREAGLSIPVVVQTAHGGIATVDDDGLIAAFLHHVFDQAARYRIVIGNQNGGSHGIPRELLCLESGHSRRCRLTHD